MITLVSWQEGLPRSPQLQSHTAEPGCSFLPWSVQRFCAFIWSFTPQVAQFSGGAVGLTAESGSLWGWGEDVGRQVEKPQLLCESQQK